MNAMPPRTCFASAWTTFEERRLASLYSSAAREEIEAAIPRHNWNAIKSRAQSLGIPRRKPSGRVIAPLVLALVAKRKLHGHTQDAIAERCGMQRSVLARLECGIISPKLITLNRWCAALDVDLVLLDRAAPQ